MDQMKSLTVDCPGGDRGIHHNVFDITNPEIEHACKAFKHLTSLSLEITTDKIITGLLLRKDPVYDKHCNLLAA